MHLPVLAALSMASAVVVAALTATPAEDKDTRLMAQLSGSVEAPGPGDPDGRGKAMLTLQPDSARVCFEIELTDVADPTQAHIHAGGTGSAGPRVVPLTTNIPTRSRGCANADRAALEKIIAKPADYYVNVHSKEHVGGAVRGQLAPAPGDASAQALRPPAR
jgi:hypothetical protein